jgi:hypothetical protein
MLPSTVMSPPAAWFETHPLRVHVENPASGGDQIMTDKELRDTDMNPGTQHGVGESTTRRGEDVIKEEGPEPGRKPNMGTKGESDRPYGKSDQRSQTGVDPQEPIDPDMPDLQGQR